MRSAAVYFVSSQLLIVSVTPDDDAPVNTNCPTVAEKPARNALKGYASSLAH